MGAEGRRLCRSPPASRMGQAPPTDSPFAATPGHRSPPNLDCCRCRRSVSTTTAFITSAVAILAEAGVGGVGGAREAGTVSGDDDCYYSGGASTTTGLCRPAAAAAPPWSLPPSLRRPTPPSQRRLPRPSLSPSRLRDPCHPRRPASTPSTTVCRTVSTHLSTTTTTTTATATATTITTSPSTAATTARTRRPPTHSHPLPRSRRRHRPPSRRRPPLRPPVPPMPAASALPEGRPAGA